MKTVIVYILVSIIFTSISLINLGSSLSWNTTQSISLHDTTGHIIRPGTLDIAAPPCIVKAEIDMLIIVGVTILLVIGIRVIKRIIKNFKFNKNINTVHSPIELKKLVTKIYNEGADSLLSSEKSKAKVWMNEMIVKIDAGEIKTLRELADYIDNKSPISKT